MCRVKCFDLIFVYSVLLILECYLKLGMPNFSQIFIRF